MDVLLKAFENKHLRKIFILYFCINKGRFMAKKYKHKKKSSKKISFKEIKRTVVIALWVIIVLAVIFLAIRYFINRQPKIKVDRSDYKELLETRLKPGMDVDSETYSGYTVYFNSEYRIPNCVCYELIRGELDGNVPRYKNFMPDPNFRRSAEPSDYTRSGFDRGHMAPAADMKWGEKAMRETFYMTNICPQHKSLNTGAWHKLENKVRDWAERDSVLIIACGPILSDDMDYIGKDNRVAVPKRFFKVLLSPSTKNVKAIGFIFENKKCKGSLQKYAVSVDSVESLTGYDFFSALNDDLETAVEAKCNYNLWNNQ